MPVIIPKNLVEKKVLDQENIFTMTEKEARAQDIRPIQVAIVNLMPNKEETELQLLKLLSSQVLQVEIDLVRTASHRPKNSDWNRLQAFYKTYEDIKDKKYDAMIITGAPVEKIEYENISYWQELKQIFDFARDHVFSTLFICWAAQAALHYFYQLDSQLLEDKLFGIYPFENIRPQNQLLAGFDDVFHMPQSRYSRLDPRALAGREDLEVLAANDQVGLALAATKDKRFVFSLGHWEYDADSLHREYLRDLDRGLGTAKPINYYQDPDQLAGIRMTWKSAANLFFSNWINFAVYQQTPYNIKTISGKAVAKFGGSSLSDSRQFLKVKEIIDQEEDRAVIVVSAPGKRHPLDIKVTDLLVDLAQGQEEAQELRLVLAKLEDRLALLEEEIAKNKEGVQERFLDICQELDLSQDLQEEIRTSLAHLDPSQGRDFILSRGEYLNAKIMAEFLGFDFIDAQELIYFQGGEVDLDRSTQEIQARIQPGQRVVVPGFYGNDQGRVKVFNRGGSDFTGSILAAALDSQVYENWTDVNGVMTEDPAKNPAARPLPRLKYAQLKEIIGQGAGVYQEEAIQPVMEKNITIRILNTNDPQQEGTLIKD